MEQSPLQPQLDDKLLQQMQALIDKNEIVECLTRYARGIDRLDVDLIRSAFHPDAIDHHAQSVRGSTEDMLDWWLPQQKDREETQHYITNHSIDITGDTAHAETYFFVIIKLLGNDIATLIGGRYADRLEKRSGEWKIALRLVMSEWHAEIDAGATRILDRIALGVERRDRSDPTYERPLQASPADL